MIVQADPPAQKSASAQSQRQLRIGVAGLGTVGGALCQLIESHAAHIQKRLGCIFTLNGVTARHRTKKRLFSTRTQPRWFSEPLSLAQSPDIDVFVEVMGGADDPALSCVKAALQAGKHVVTANKALLATHGRALAALAERHNVCLNYEAAVAGGTPIIKTLRESLAGNKITRIYGILNGTCNYILTRMEKEGLSFESCLKDAQALGYAEADARFDVGGHDTAHKLALLTSLAFGVRVPLARIFVDGINAVSQVDMKSADVLGYRIKLLGVAHRSSLGIEGRVHPTMVPKDSSIARIDGVLNAIAVEADCIGSILLTGPGAGGRATASSLLSDLCDIARGDRMAPFGMPLKEMEDPSFVEMGTHQGAYYVRLSVYDRLGTFAILTQCMADHKISLKSIVQNSSETGGNDESRFAKDIREETQIVVLVTHRTSEQAIQNAFMALASRNILAHPPYMIRIEHLS